MTETRKFYEQEEKLIIVLEVKFYYDGMLKRPE